MAAVTMLYLEPVGNAASHQGWQRCPLFNPLTTAGKGSDMHGVTGIGGIIIKSKDAAGLQQWYATQLGIEVQTWGGTVFDSSPGVEGAENALVWAVHDDTSAQFENTTAPFIVNYRVHDLESLIAKLKAAGCRVSENVVRSEFGLFAWVIDPDGNKAELWQAL